MCKLATASAVCVSNGIRENGMQVKGILANLAGTSAMEQASNTQNQRTVDSGVEKRKPENSTQLGDLGSESTVVVLRKSERDLPLPPKQILDRSPKHTLPSGSHPHRQSK
jgi:hypothetical protein